MSVLQTCDICQPKGKAKHQAVFFCLDDKQYFCLECATIHQRINTTYQHQMQCLIPQNTDVPCLHQNQQKFYCERHRDLCCEQCRNTSHKDCEENIRIIDNILQEESILLTQSTEVLRKLEKLKIYVKMTSKSTEAKEKQWIKQMQRELDRMNEAKVKLEQKIKIKMDYLKHHMKRRRENIEQKKNDLQNATNEIQIKQTRMKQPANSNAEKVEMITALKDSLKQYEGLLNSDISESHMAYLKTVEHDFEAEHNVSATLETFLETVTSLNTIYSEVHSYIFPNENVAQCDEMFLRAEAVRDADDTEVKSVIKRHRTQSERQAETTRIMVERTRTRSESRALENQKHLIHRENTGVKLLLDPRRPKSEEAGSRHISRSLEWYQQLIEEKESESVPSIPIQSHCQMNVRIPSDQTPCGITGLAKLHDGFLLMADYENSKLKMFASCGDFRGQLVCRDKPRDMATIKNNEFIVNFPVAKKIHFVTVKTGNTEYDKEIILGKKIETNAKCCGIAFHRNKIYAATQIPHQILIINVNGEVENTIKGDNLFERATYIAVAPDSSLIYISDPTRKVVLGITEEKEEKFRHTVERPHGIVCVGNGMLLVADWNWDTGTIHLIDETGVRIGSLAVENCYCPQKLVFYSDCNTLLVSQWQKDILTTIYLGDNKLMKPQLCSTIHPTCVRSKDHDC